MGGFHIALNFSHVVGQRYEQNGFEDLLIEAGLYGASTVNKIMQGKIYNRAIRAHKISFEALMRLK